MKMFLLYLHVFNLYNSTCCVIYHNEYCGNTVQTSVHLWIEVSHKTCSLQHTNMVEMFKLIVSYINTNKDGIS